MRKLYNTLLVSSLLLSSVLPTSLFCATRGIRVTAGKGQSLYLYKDYYALVAGISDYEKWPDLPNASNDAREVASGLKQIGFKVKLVLDPTSKELKKAFSDLAYQMGNEKNRALLFYFAGHGETLELADGTDLGYIIPSDCPLKNRDPVGFDSRAISMKDLEVLALKVKSKHFIMLFDSCFSGSLFNMLRAAPVNISEKSALPVRQFITAGAAGEQVPDKSVFKNLFLQGIAGESDLNNDGYVTGAELGMHLQERVVNYTRGGQHPQYGKINNPKLDRGDFIFVPPKVSGKETAEEQAAKTAAGDTVSKDKGSQAPQAKDARLAYIPKATKALYDALRNGRGDFVIDDFENTNLWSTNFVDQWKYRKKGFSKIRLSADPTQGASGTACSMKIEYELSTQSSLSIRIGGTERLRQHEVENDRSTAYDLSRFNKITFYLKGEKAGFLFSKTNKILVGTACYIDSVRSRYGKIAAYYNRTDIVPDKEWKKIEVSFHDFVPTAWTKKNVSNYPPLPDLRNTLTIFFMLSSFQGDGGSPGSNTIWIDEIILQ